MRWVSEKSLNLEKNNKKKTGSLDIVIEEKTSQFREKQEVKTGKKTSNSCLVGKINWESAQNNPMGLKFSFI